MARITVEDCLENVDNRFGLVLLASKRARQLVAGKEPMLPWENDKPTVMALREISAGKVTVDILKQMAAQEKAQAEAEAMTIEEEDSEAPEQV